MGHICNRVWATFDTAWPHGTIRQLQMSHRSTKYRVTSGRLSTCYKPRQARLMTFMEHLVCRKQLCVLCLIQMEDLLLLPFFLWCIVVCVNQESGPFPPTRCRMWVNTLGFSLSRGSETILILSCQYAPKFKRKNSSSLSQWREKLGQF